MIYSSNQKLVFSNVNLKLVSQMCTLNSPSYRDSLVMADAQTLVIGMCIHRYRCSTVSFRHRGRDSEAAHTNGAPRRECESDCASAGNEHHCRAVQSYGGLVYDNRGTVADVLQTMSSDGGRVCRASASKMAVFHSSSAIGSWTSRGGNAAGAGTSGVTADGVGIGGTESDVVEVHSVLVLDQNTFEVIHAHELGRNEVYTWALR